MQPMSLAAIAAVCLATVTVGILGLRMSRATSDFYVAGRAITPRRNASAIAGEYLSAAGNAASTSCGSPSAIRSATSSCSS